MLSLVAAYICVAQVQSSQTPESPNPSPEKIYRVGGAVNAPRAIVTPDPEYSEEARQAHYSATSVLWLIVGSDGVPRGVKVARRAGKGLDEKAVEAVRQWRFQPALKDGHPVAVQINIEVNFRLKDDLPPPLERLREKALAGDAKAQLQLAKAFLAGKAGSVNQHDGVVWLTKAANQGVPEAQFRLGEYLSEYSNSPSNLVTAYMWYSVAERQHYKDAGKRLKALALKMSPEQISDAQAKADHWTAAAK